MTTEAPLLIDPQIPFVFLPKANFNEYKKEIQYAHPDISCDDDDCYFKNPCNQVPELGLNLVID